MISSVGASIGYDHGSPVSRRYSDENPFAGTLHVLGILVALFFAISAFVLYQPFIESDVRSLPRPNAIGFYAHLGFREVDSEPGGLLMGLRLDG